MRYLVPLLVLAACTQEPKEEPEDTTETEETDSPADTDETAEPAGPVTVATGTDGELTVELQAKHGLLVGWNELRFVVTDGEGALVTGATLTQAPLMDMGDHMHACPYTQPVEDGDGVYVAELVPIMGSGMMGSWSNTVTVTLGDATHTVVLEDLEVAESGLKKDLSVGDMPWIVTLTPMADPEVGTIPFVLTVHSMADMMTFPPVDDLTLTVEPTMPSMGHGSNGNVDPVWVANGRYEGVMGFSMGGAWEVEIAVTRGEEALGSVVFEFEL